MTSPFRITSRKTYAADPVLLRRLIFAVLAMIAAISPWSGWVPLSVLWQKILLSIVLLAVAVFSIVGAAQIARRKHSGRIISLTLDYLGFVFCFIITMS